MSSNNTKMTKDNRLALIKEKFASYPDFPKAGILFQDFLPVLRDPKAFRYMLELFEEYITKNYGKIDCIVGIEARGFLIGPALALMLNVSFVPVRKPGKLPGVLEKETYFLEYGHDCIEIQRNSLTKGMKVVIVDDLLATGGTMEAAVKLVKKLDCTVLTCMAVSEIEALKGKEKLSAPFYGLISF